MVSSLKKRIVVVSSVFGLLFFASCASNQKNGATETAEAVSIGVPKRKKDSYFFAVPEDVMTLAENGSPSSIRGLISKIHKPLKENYTDQEIVLLNICASIMEIAWPSEPFTTDIPSADFYNPYTPIINSVQCGIYDTGSGNSDFFSIFLPNLILLTGDMKNEYCDAIKQSLEKCLGFKKDSLLVNYMLGMVHLRMGNPELALEYFNKVGNSPREVLSGKNKGFFACGDYEKSVELSRKILEAAPGDRQTMEILCKSFVKLERWDEASVYSINLLQLDPENVDYGLLRAKILVSTGEYLKASTLLDFCEKLSPKHKDYLLLRAWLQKNWTKNIPAAVDIMTTAVSLYPEDFETLLFATQVASISGSKIGNYTVIDMVKKLMEMDNGNITVKELYIKEMLKLGKYQEAYDVSSELIESGNNNIDVICDYIEACNGLSKKEESWKSVEELYQQNPNSEKVIQIYVKTFVAQGKNKDALELIEKLIPEVSNSMKSFLYYEKSLVDSGMDAILADLRSSLACNARNVDSLYRMYKIYYSNQNWKMAQFYLKQVASIKTHDPDIQAKLSELEFLTGK